MWRLYLEGGDIFVATFFEPASVRDVETVFEKRATPEMRKALASLEKERSPGGGIDEIEGSKPMSFFKKTGRETTRGSSIFRRLAD